MPYAVVLSIWVANTFRAPPASDDKWVYEVRESVEKSGKVRELFSQGNSCSANLRHLNFEIFWRACLQISPLLSPPALKKESSRTCNKTLSLVKEKGQGVLSKILYEPCIKFIEFSFVFNKCLMT